MMEQLSINGINRLIGEKPYIQKVKEKAVEYGTKTLNDIEILMLALNIDIEKAKKIEENLELPEFHQMELYELEKYISSSKAIQIKAALELGKRIQQYDKKTVVLDSSGKVAELVMEEMRYLRQEVLVVLYLDTKLRVIREETLFKGTRSQSLLDAKEIYTHAFKNNADSIIICHNHPSGDPTASEPDIKSTKKIVEAGKIVNIRCLDHIIIGNGIYVSLREKGYI